MTLSAISHYRGGSIDEVAPSARRLKAIYLKYGVGYRLSRFQTGPNEGDWLVIVTYADATAYEKAQALFPRTRNCSRCSSSSLSSKTGSAAKWRSISISRTIGLGLRWLG
jgi:hypothetical protein